MSLSCRDKQERKVKEGQKYKSPPHPSGRSWKSIKVLALSQEVDWNRPTKLAGPNGAMVPKGRRGHDEAHDLVPSDWLSVLASTLHFSGEGELERSFGTIKQIHLEVLFFPPPPSTPFQFLHASETYPREECLKHKLSDWKENSIF